MQRQVTQGFDCVIVLSQGQLKAFGTALTKITAHAKQQRVCEQRLCREPHSLIQGNHTSTPTALQSSMPHVMTRPISCWEADFE